MVNALNTKFSWAQRRRDQQKDIEEYRRLEQLVVGACSNQSNSNGRLHINQVRRRPKHKEPPRSALVDKFHETGPIHVFQGPEECRGLVPGLESRRELNAATKATLARLNNEVASLTSQLQAAHAKIAQLEANATAAEDCAALAKQNAKLRERNRELTYQIKQGIEKANSTADELQHERIAFNNEKQKFLKEMRKQKAELDRQSQLLLQAQLPDRTVRERVEHAEAALASYQQKSQSTIERLKAEIARQKVEIEQLKHTNSQLKEDLQAVESRRLQTWQNNYSGNTAGSATDAPEQLKELHKSIKRRVSKKERTGSESIIHPDGRTVTVQDDGTVVTKFVNGAIKTVYTNGHIQMKFANGDERYIYPDREEYRYAADGILHITLSDGVQKFEFPGGQKETHYPDGSKEIIYSDGVIKYQQANGDYEVHWPIGLVGKVTNGDESNLLNKEGDRSTDTDENTRLNR